MRSPLICVVCGSQFTHRKSSKQTCSRPCLGELIRRRRVAARTSPTGTDCIICGQWIAYRNSDAAADGRRTCSAICFGELRSRLKGGLGEGTCAGCGTKYKVTRCFLRMGRRFCGDPCRLKWFRTQRMCGEQNPQWRGGYHRYYGASWRPAKKLALSRAQRKCEDCGETCKSDRSLDVHHIRPFRLFGIERHAEANALSNLRCLCNRCHTKTEWRDYGSIFWDGRRKAIRIREGR